MGSDNRGRAQYEAMEYGRNGLRILDGILRRMTTEDAERLLDAEGRRWLAAVRREDAARIRSEARARERKAKRLEAERARAEVLASLTPEQRAALRVVGGDS